MTDMTLTTEPIAEVLAGPEPTGRARAMGTARFVATKIGGGLISLFLVVVLGFFLFRALPGNPVRALTADVHTSLEQVQRIRQEWSLDKPLWGQFVDYLRNL